MKTKVGPVRLSVVRFRIRKRSTISIINLKTYTIYDLMRILWLCITVTAFSTLAMIVKSFGKSEP